MNTSEREVIHEALLDTITELGALKARVESQGRKLTWDEIKEAQRLLDQSKTLKNLERSMKEPLKPDPQYQPGDRDRYGMRGTGPKPFVDFGEMLQCVARAATPGHKPDDRLFEVQVRAAGMSEGVGSEGGFLVQQDFSLDLLKGAFETGKLASRCRKFEIGPGKNGVDLPCYNETSRATGSRLGGITGYWLSEGAEKIDSKPTLRMVSLQLKKLIGLCYSTDELLEDRVLLAQVIKEGFASEFGFLLDLAIFSGSGAGQPLGIMNSGALVTVAAEDGQAAATIQAENIVKMYSRWSGNDATGCWLVNRSALPQLYTMGVTLGLGGAPIFMPAGGISGKPYNTILGMPVLIIEQASALGTTGDIVLADLSEYVLIDKAGIQTAVSIHVRYVYDESTFRFVYRVDGQPIPAAPVTPYAGGDTLSPFVALATRS